MRIGLSVPRQGESSALTFLVLFFVVAAEATGAPPAPHWRGRWSPQDTLAAPAVHLVMLPGNGTDHSQVLWWQHGLEGFQWGGLLAWNPAPDDSITLGAWLQKVPSVDDPVGDIFCAGHAHLSDGRLLVSGGSIPGTENGLELNQLFDPTTRQWSLGPDLNYGRWYPTATALGSSEVLITSGSQYHPMFVFGGVSSADTTRPTDDTVYNMAVLQDESFWRDPLVRPPSTPWPPPMEGMTVSRLKDGTEYMFGGADSVGSFSDKVWRFQRNPNEFGPDFTYQWQDFSPNITGLAPKRSEHASVPVLDQTPFGSLYVLGGRDEEGGTSEEVWRLFFDQFQPAPGWRWLQMIPSSTNGTPGPREGHTAFLDPPRKRILLFGGRESSTADPESTSVWILQFNSDYSSASWERPEVEGTPPPSRYDHTWSRGFAGRRLGHSYGVLYGGSDSSHDPLGDMWTLWIDESDGSLEWTAETFSGASPAARTAHVGSITGGTRRLKVHGGGTTTGLVDSVAFEAVLGVYGQPTVWDTLVGQPSPRRNHAGFESTSSLVFARQPEIYTPQISGGGSVNAIADSYKLQNWYPQMFQMPGGKVFFSGPTQTSYELDVDTGEWTPRPVTSSGFLGGTAVQYTPGHIIKIGSRENDGTGALALATAKVIDMTPGSADSAWTSSRFMSAGRVYHNATLLPTGEILVTGGTEFVDNDELLGEARTTPELWRATTESDTLGVWYGGWGELAPSNIVRDYHSSAVLLPDGRVLIAGGNAHHEHRLTSEIFSPPYLFRAADSSAVTRPEIVDAPPAANYGATFRIVSPEASDVESICLIKPGAATHAYDQGQLFVPLPTFSVEDDSIFVTAPASPDSAPPGDYMLFILKDHPDDSSQGVPSIARWIRLSPDVTAPNPVASFEDPLVSQTSIGLEWIATGDDAAVGTATQYDVRYSTSGPISEATFATASAASGEPVPYPSGASQLVQISNLLPCTDYWFAIKTRDEAFNWSSVALPSGPIKTMCGGGGGLGSTAQEVADGAAIEPGGSMRQVQMASAGAVTLGGSLGKESMASSSEGEASPLFIVEFEESDESTVLRLGRTSQPIPVPAEADANSILIQRPDGVGGWATRDSFRPGLNDGDVGLGPLRGTMRFVGLGGYALTQVAGSVATGDGSRSLVQATHSALGDVTAEVESLGTVALADSEFVEIQFENTVATATDLGWYVVLSRSSGPGWNARQEPLADGTGGRPFAFALHQNQPNPFHGTTLIRFDLPAASDVEIEIYDLLGRRVRTIARGRFAPGFHSASWDQRDDRGNTLNAGVFLYRLKAGAFSAHRKMILLR